MPFLEQPVYMASVVIGGAEVSIAAMRRGLFQRFEDKLLKFDQVNASCKFRFHKPGIFHCPDVRFVSGSDNAALKKPSPASISWFQSEFFRKPDVFADGTRLGVTKKMRGTAQSRVGVCRLEVMTKIKDLHSSASGERNCVTLSNIAYRHLKDFSSEYCKTLSLLKELVLCNWTKKVEDFQMFSLS